MTAETAHSFKRYDEAAVVQTDPETGNRADGGEIWPATVTETGPYSVRARYAGGSCYFLVDSRGRAWADGGRLRLVPVCFRCSVPVLGTPVTAEGDPLRRQFCSGGCLESDAERAGGAFADVEYSAESD